MTQLNGNHLKPLEGLFILFSMLVLVSEPTWQRKKHFLSKIFAAETVSQRNFNLQLCIKCTYRSSRQVS